MKYNKHGYRQQETYFYEIEVNESMYFVEVDVTWFIKPADSSTWDSSDDYYGYSEITNVDITKISTEDDKGDVIDVQFTELSEEVQKEINATLDVLITEEHPEENEDYEAYEY